MNYPCLLSIGSNIGDKIKQLNLSIYYLEKNQDILIRKKSFFYLTEPLEFTNQPHFINAIILIETWYSPEKLLVFLQGIEKKVGRKKRFPKGPREIDIDILTYGDLELNSKELVLPHPSIFTRPFIREILSDMDELDIYKIFSNHKDIKYA